MVVLAFHANPIAIMLVAPGVPILTLDRVNKLAGLVVDVWVAP
jgi:hypothetical protein